MQENHMLFAKKQSKKKRNKHQPSIMQDKDDKTCYVCRYLSGDTTEWNYREEHHIFGGRANRRLSEENGLKVKLCYAHHRNAKIGVHFNPELDLWLRRTAQAEFEKTRTREEFVSMFGKSVL